MFCPKCKAEYTAGVWICADCKVELVKELPEETEQKTKDDENNDLPLNEFEELYVANTSVEVALLKSILDDARIKYYCSGETMHIVPQFFGGFYEVRFWIYKDDIPDALKILKDFENQKPIDSSDNPPAEQ